MRLFIATNFPPDVLEDLDGRTTRLRPRLPSAAWVRPSSHHLTFAFLGDQQDALVAMLDQPLREQLAAVASFEARLSGCGFFPNARRARVGWIGVEPGERFVAIAEIVRRIVTGHGVVLDQGEFRPHLTLLRIRDPWPPASIDLFSRTLRDYRSEPFTIDTVTLFSSKLDPRGAIHTPLQTYPLGA